MIRRANLVISSPISEEIELLEDLGPLVFLSFVARNSCLVILRVYRAGFA